MLCNSAIGPLAAANLRRRPNPGLKLAAAYFSRKEIVRLHRRSRLILAAAYFRSYKWPLCVLPGISALIHIRE